MMRGLRAAIAAAAILVAAAAPPAAAAGPIVVTSTADTVADDGVCTLREAVAAANTDSASGTTAGECAAGTTTPDTIVFDVGGTITLASGALGIGGDLTIDASGGPAITVSGGHADRVFIVNAGATVVLRSLTVTDGLGTDLAGGILDNGALTLEHVTVANNAMTTASNDWWKGGGGIYVGGGGSLDLVESTVSGNTTQASGGGGIYVFQGATVRVLRSTIGGNVAADSGGAILSHGTLTLANSTVSGNSANGWHGGALFVMDGTTTLVNSTIANNVAPDWSPSAIFVGSWSPTPAVLTLTNTLITGNHWYACEHWTVPGTVTSGGHNVVQDDTCNAGAPAPTDVIAYDAVIGALADNGGATRTHALLAGSPAIGAGDPATCTGAPVSGLDQRHYARPATTCDIGAFDSNATANTAPAIAVQGVEDGATYEKGSVPAATCAVTDAEDGPSSFAATLSDLGTSGVGSQTATCSYTDTGGLTATASAVYAVAYPWTGFLQPIDAAPTLNTVKAGAGVPVRFMLGGDEGLAILAAGSPSSQRVACDSQAPTDVVETTVTAGRSTLAYDATTGAYTYVWRTDRGWANTCRELVVQLADGTEHVAWFQFRK